MSKPAYIDVTREATEVSIGYSRFALNVLLSYRLWDLCVNWSEIDSELQTYQDTKGRLFDILLLCGIAINKDFDKFNEEYRIHFVCNIIPKDGKSKLSIEKSLTATLTLGDNQLYIVIDLA